MANAIYRTPKSHTVFHVSLGTALLLAALTVLVGGAILIAGLRGGSKPEPERRLFPRIGSAGSAEAIEATYGPLNKAALGETKEGLFSRIRARRASRQCVPCTPAMYSRPTVALVPMQPRYTEPVYRVPSSTSAPAQLEPLNQPLCPTCPLEIRPSVNPKPATIFRGDALRAELLEAEWGPLNKAALSETKQKDSSGPARIAATVDPADIPPSLPPLPSPAAEFITSQSPPRPILFEAGGRFEIHPSR